MLAPPQRIRLRAATRSSVLARWQTSHVTRHLQLAHPLLQIDPVYIDTLGDRTQSIGTPLHEIGGQGVFVKEVQAAVLCGDADLAVHSAKDLPSETAPGLRLAAIPLRADTRDILIGSTLAGLPVGAKVGTSSIRHAVQLRALRPDLVFVPMRGNVTTRVARVAELDAIVLALAGLERLELLSSVTADHPTEILGTDVMVPMVGQGALAIECRADDDETAALLAAITDPLSDVCVRAERAFLARLGAGCTLPVAALATPTPTHAALRPTPVPELSIDALVGERNGPTILRRRLQGSAADPIGLGTAVAEALLGDGATRLLADD